MKKEKAVPPAVEKRGRKARRERTMERGAAALVRLRVAHKARNGSTQKLRRRKAAPKDARNAPPQKGAKRTAWSGRGRESLGIKNSRTAAIFSAICFGCRDSGEKQGHQDKLFSIAEQ